MLSEKT